MSKVCSKCRLVKDAAAFHRNPQQKSGLHPSCKDCRAARNALPAVRALRVEQNLKYGLANRARNNAREKARRDGNPALHAAGKRAEYLRNRASHVARSAAYRKAHPHKWIEYERRRRAQKRASQCLPLTKKDIARRFSVFGDSCAYCGRSDVPLTVDHAKPIARGGPHILANIRPACRPCNSRKHTRTISEFKPKAA